MATNKRPVKQEALLITVARKLGQAAGTLTNATQELKESFSTLPDTVTKKVRNAANIGTPAKRPRASTGSRTRRPRKTTSRVAPKPRAASRSKRKPLHRRARPQ